MTASLEREEWKAFSDFMALVASGLCALVGLILTVAGKDPAMRFHGCLLLAAAGLAFLYILTQVVEKAEPKTEAGYADGVIRAGVIATMFWGVVGLLVGVVIALQLAFPALNFDLPWTNFGRLRPLHTSAVIFAFGGNALIATSLLCRAAHLPRAAGRRLARPGSCSGATSCSSCWPRPAICSASPRAANTPSPNGTSTSG